MTETPKQPQREDREGEDSLALAPETLKDLDLTDEQSAHVQGGTGNPHTVGTRCVDDTPCVTR